MESELVRVVSVEPETMRREEFGITYYIPIGLRLGLEDGREFKIYSVPYDVVEAIVMLKRGDPPPRRQSLFAFLAYHEDFKFIFDRVLDKVVIDEFDPNTGLYTATVYFESDGIRLQVKMIPSHAIYLALVTDKPIYVSERLVQMYEEEMEYEEEEYEDEFDDEEF